MSTVGKFTKISSGFTPQSIPGLSLWLDGADRNTLTLSGSNVTAWKDKGPSNVALTLSNASGGSAIATTFSNAPVVQFASSCFYSSTFSFPLATRSIFFVVAEVVHADWRGLVNFADTVGQSDYNTVNGYAITSTNTIGSNVQFSQNGYGGGGVLYNYNAGTGSLLVPFQVYADVTSNTNATITVTGSNSYSATTSTAGQTSTGFTVAGRGGAPSAGTLAVAEVILFSTAISVTQRQQVEGYLASKWGLKPNIPAIHPFKTIAPFTRGFQPIDISGLTVWLDGADATTVTLSGSNITQWNDKSGNGYVGTSTTGRNFTYATSVRNGLNSVQTATGQGMLVSNVTLGAALSAFVMYMPINQADGSPFIEHGPDTNSGRGFFIQANTAGQLGISNTSGYAFNNIPTPSISNTWQLIEAVNVDTDAGNLGSFYVNGDRKFTQTAITGTSLTQTLFINGRNNTNAYSYPTYLGEVLIYNQPLTRSQRQQVESYLANKWATTSTFLSTHPFKLFPTMTTSFTPKEISGLSLWLDAADYSSITLSGSNVTQWNDKSGNGRNTSTFGNPPTFASNAVYFTTNQGLVVTLSASTNVESGFFVCGFTNFNSVNTLIGSATSAGVSGGRQFRCSTTLQTLNQDTANILSSGTNVSLNTRHVVGYTNNGTTLTHYLNGSTYASGSSGTYPTGKLTTSIGGRESLGVYAEPLNGYINEIIMFSVALNPSQKSIVEGYLAQKWGLSANLPATHPYKKVTP